LGQQKAVKSLWVAMPGIVMARCSLLAAPEWPGGAALPGRPSGRCLQKNHTFINRYQQDVACGVQYGLYLHQVVFLLVPIPPDCCSLLGRSVFFPSVSVLGFKCLSGICLHSSQTFPKETNMSTQTGVVKWFNDAKGFGFITPDAGGADVFAHFQDIQSNGFRSLSENQRVSFDRGVGPKGEKATNIKVI
jgi:CspA family cold shock protein